ncbi:hypothetical protein Q5752_003249 [Cryptotrichosporon argae]
MPNPRTKRAKRTTSQSITSSSIHTPDTHPAPPAAVTLPNAPRLHLPSTLPAPPSTIAPTSIHTPVPTDLCPDCLSPFCITLRQFPATPWLGSTSVGSLDLGSLVLSRLPLSSHFLTRIDDLCLYKTRKILRSILPDEDQRRAKACAFDLEHGPIDAVRKDLADIIAAFPASWPIGIQAHARKLTEELMRRREVEQGCAGVLGVKDDVGGEPTAEAAERRAVQLASEVDRLEQEVQRLTRLLSEATMTNELVAASDAATTGVDQHAATANIDTAAGLFGTVGAGPAEAASRAVEHGSDPVDDDPGVNHAVLIAANIKLQRELDAAKTREKQTADRLDAIEKVLGGWMPDIASCGAGPDHVLEADIIDAQGATKAGEDLQTAGEQNTEVVEVELGGTKDTSRSKHGGSEEDAIGEDEPETKKQRTD